MTQHGQVELPRKRFYVQVCHTPLAAGVSTRQVQGWIAQGLLRVFRPSKRLTLVRWDDLTALIEGRARERDDAEPAAASA